MQTKLGRRFLRQSLLIGALGSLTIGLASFGLLNRQAQMISQQEILASSARAEALVQFLPNELISRVTDWGNWDDSYLFALGKNPAFAHQYVNAKSLSDAGVDVITILQKDGTLAAQYIKKEQSPLSSAWLKSVQEEAALVKFLPNEKPTSGYRNINGHLFLIAATLIRPTSYSKSTSGIMVMGREITPQQLSKSLQTSTFFGPSRDGKEVIQNDKAVVEIPLPRITQKDAASLYINVDLPATANARTQQIVQTLWLVLLSIIAAVAMLKVMERLVTRRIIVLEKQMDRIASKNFKGFLPDDDAGDEISSLVSKFNQLLQQLGLQNKEERRLREEAQGALDIAVKAEQAKSNFIAVTSHEIRTPLAAVLGGIELLQTKKLPPDIADITRRLENSGERLRNIVDDVLDFSRIEHEGVPIDLQPVNLVETIGRIVDSYSAKASGKGLDLQFRPFLSPDDVFRTDAFRIQQVLGNLIANALKFTDKGSVTVSLKQTDDGHVRLEVDDTGVGINAAQVEKLFRPFAQADKSTVRRFGGTGLGLSICKRIVEAMGGEIGVISKPGLGSIFWFQLALESVAHDTAPAIAAPARDASPVIAAKPLAILIVEDNQMVQAIVQDQLALMGHHPTSVSNGLAAFNAISGGSFDAVLMDMHMPLMDGIAATRAIRALGPARGGMPIIALTADADKSRRSIYDDSGFHAFLTKPCNTPALAAALANVEPRKRAKKRVNNSPAVDPTLMSEIEQTMGKDALGRYLQQFMQQLDPAISEILSSDKPDSASKVAAVAHKLKGSALSIGAVRMQKVLASLEVRARSGMSWQSLRAALTEASSDLKIVIESMNNSTLSKV